jgi:hypothetical protein
MSDLTTEAAPVRWIRRPGDAIAIVGIAVLAAGMTVV